MSACKVLQTKLWATQIVIRVSEEPVCVSRGPGRSVLVATRQGWIELHSVSGGRSHLRWRFRTVCSRIVHLALLPTLLGDSIVTVEAQQQGSEMHALRVYSGWRRPDPVCVSVALSSSADALACCEAGLPRVAVASANGVTLYHCDGGAVVPLFEIAVSGAQRLALHGDFIGWAVGGLVHVLRIRVAEEGDASEGDAGEDSGAACVNVVVDGGVGMAGRLYVPSLARDAQPFVAVGPFRNVAISVKADEGWIVRACDTVLVQRLAGSVHSLRFAAEPDISSCSARRSAGGPQPLVRCLVSTAESASLFSLSRPGLLASYTYSSPTFMAVMDGSLLYALQSAQDRVGASLVEIFSLRPSDASLPVTTVAASELGDWTVLGSSGGGTVGSAATLPPPCMMASLPFVGLQAVATMTAGSVALMSKMINEQDAFWSVSVLFPEKAVEIWRELAGKASLLKNTDPDTFLLFHLEGLLVLGSRLCLMAGDKSPLDVSVICESAAEEPADAGAEDILADSGGGGVAGGGGNVAMDDLEATRSLFLEGCRVLGDFFESKRVFDSAVVFWGMCLLPIDEVTRRLLPERQAAVALVEFVNRALAENDSRLAKVGIGVGNSLIEHLAKHRPSELPRAILTCGMSYDPTLAVKLLVRVGTPVETFARAYTLAITKDEKQCVAALRSLDSTVLLQLLESYEAAWIGQERQLTAFGVSLLGACGFSVLEAVSRKGDAVTPREAMQLLGGGLAPLFLVYLENVLEIEGSAHKEAAAELLADGYAQRCGSVALAALPPDWSAMVDQFACMRLVDLSVAPLEIRWALRHWRGLFRASRPSWLDGVPPFSSGEGSVRGSFYFSKLQTLLVSLKRFGAARMRIAESLEHRRDAPQLRDWCRLFWLPVLNKLPEALELVYVSLSNEACVGFCVEFCGSAADWKTALERFQGSKPAVHLALVIHCAESFDPRQLVFGVFPESGSLPAYLQHIWRSQKNSSLLPLIGQFAAQHEQ